MYDKNIENFDLKQTLNERDNTIHLLEMEGQLRAIVDKTNEVKDFA